MRKIHIDGRLGATISSKLVGLGLGGGGGGDGSGGGGLVGVTGAAREACLLAAFEKAVMRMWPAFCHIDAQRGRVSSGEDGEPARQIADNSDEWGVKTVSKCRITKATAIRKDGDRFAVMHSDSQRIYPFLLMMKVTF